MANKTFRDIQDNVLSLISKSDATTRNRVRNWINMGQNDFVIRELWPFREKTATFDTIPGTQEYDIKTYMTDIDEQNIISVALQGANQQKLSYWPYNQLRADKPDFEMDGAAVPRRYYIKAGQMGFWPKPAGEYKVVIDYYNLPEDMEDDTDEPAMPLGYREALVHYAISLEHDFNTDPDLAVKSLNRYEQIVTLARNNLLTQPVDTGNFRILGPADAQGWVDVDVR